MLQEKYVHVKQTVLHMHKAEWCCIGWRDGTEVTPRDVRGDSAHDTPPKHVKVVIRLWCLWEVGHDTKYGRESAP